MHYLTWYLIAGVAITICLYIKHERDFEGLDPSAVLIACAITVPFWPYFLFVEVYKLFSS